MSIRANRLSLLVVSLGATCLSALSCSAQDSIVQMCETAAQVAPEYGSNCECALTAIKNQISSDQSTPTSEAAISRTLPAGSTAPTPGMRLASRSPKSRGCLSSTSWRSRTRSVGYTRRRSRTVQADAGCRRAIRLDDRRRTSEWAQAAKWSVFLMYQSSAWTISGQTRV
jgi:hypothetical protein